MLFIFMLPGKDLQDNLKVELDGLLQVNQKPDALLQLSDNISANGNGTDISKRKDMSKLIYKPPCGSETRTLTIVRERMLTTKEGGHIAIVGQAQIGKTHFVKQLFSNKTLKKNFDYVFYVSLKYADLSKEMNVMQFLTNESKRFRWFDYDPQSRPADYQLFKRIVERIHENSSKVCIILDDFEHINFSFSDYAETKFVFEKNAAGYLLSNTLKTWFKQSLKVLVLPPWQFFQLQRIDELSSMFVTYVQGINSDGKEELLGENVKRGCNITNCPLNETCLGFVTACQTTKGCCVCYQCHNFNCHYEIQMLCSNPGNCLQLEKYSQVLSSTSAVVTAAAILKVWLDKVFGHSSSNAKDSFKRISRFAWESYAQNMFLFYESDLCKKDVLSQKERNTFFSIMHDCPLEKSAEGLSAVVFYFSHLLLHELLAALWLLTLNPNEFKQQLKANRDFFKSKRVDVLFKVMAEICQSSLLKSYRKSLFWTITPENFTELDNFKKGSGYGLTDILKKYALKITTISIVIVSICVAFHRMYF